MKSSNIDKLKSIWVAICTCALILPIGAHTYIPYTSHFHYYCRDHLGNNRVVVGEDGEIEQVTHYYPYGGLPEGTYPIISPNDGTEWRKPGVGGAVAHRGVRFHYSGSSDVRNWTQGCFVLSYSYLVEGGRIKYIPSESIKASRHFDELMGGGSHFLYKTKRGKEREGSLFPHPINNTLILK